MNADQGYPPEVFAGVLHIVRRYSQNASDEQRLEVVRALVPDRDELLAALGGDQQFDEAFSREHHSGGYEHAGRWNVYADFALLPGESVWVFGEDA